MASYLCVCSLPIVLPVQKAFTLLIPLLAYYSLATAQCIKPSIASPYFENFETGLGGWTPGGDNADWAYGTPSKSIINAAASGSKCWITGGLTGNGYSAQNSFLLSPCFDLTALTTPYITFKIFWDTERQYDGGSFQYSLNDGVTWNTLGAVNPACPSDNWFNTTNINVLGAAGWSGNTLPTSPCTGGAGGGKGQWVTARHSLNALAGKDNVMFRVRFGAGTVCNDYNGIAFDDVYIGNAPPNNAAFSHTCTSSNAVSFSPSSIACGSTVVWNFGDAASGANNTSTQLNAQHNFSAPGSYEVSLTVSHPSFATVSSTTTIHIAAVTILINQPVSCNGRSDGALKATVTGPALPYAFTWNNNPAANTAAINNLSAGTYEVKVSAAGACPVSTSFNLSEPQPLVGIPNITHPSCNLPNGSIEISTSGGTTPYKYYWQPSVSSSFKAENLAQGNYTIKIIDENGCSDTATATLTNGGSLSINLGADTVICPGETLLLAPGPFKTFLWQNSNTAPTFTVNKTGKFWVRVTDDKGCEASDTISVTVNCDDIYFPTAFTPNNDGRNDYFGAIGNTAAASNFRLNVYDRWGKLVFSTTNVAARWNGNRNGLLLPGTYIYVADYLLIGRGQRRQQGTMVLIL